MQFYPALRRIQQRRFEILSQASLYEVKSLHTRIFLKRKLYTLRMSESTSVTDHINNLNTLFAQLSTVDFNIIENERAELLLQSLPDSYDQLVINIKNYIPFSLIPRRKQWQPLSWK